MTVRNEHLRQNALIPGHWYYRFQPDQPAATAIRYGDRPLEISGTPSRVRNRSVGDGQPDALNGNVLSRMLGVLQCL